MRRSSSILDLVFALNLDAPFVVETPVAILIFDIAVTSVDSACCV